MLTIATLRALSETRLEDARTLLLAGRNEGSLYMCGYAVELALKARICETLGWDGFPESNSGFQFYQSFRTHDLKRLLHLSGVEKVIEAEMSADWSTISRWDRDLRYTYILPDDFPSAEELIAAAERILEAM